MDNTEKQTPIRCKTRTIVSSTDSPSQLSARISNASCSGLFDSYPSSSMRRFHSYVYIQKDQHRICHPGCATAQSIVAGPTVHPAASTRLRSRSIRRARRDAFLAPPSSYGPRLPFSCSAAPASTDALTSSGKGPLPWGAVAGSELASDASRSCVGVVFFRVCFCLMYFVRVTSTSATSPPPRHCMSSPATRPRVTYHGTFACMYPCGGFEHNIMYTCDICVVMRQADLKICTPM